MTGKNLQYVIVLISIVFFCSCAEKVDPQKEIENNRNEIINAAPISSDYTIIEPAQNLSNTIKAFSGQWVGKWNDVHPSQLVVTSVSREKATFIYSWGANPSKNIDAGFVTRTVNFDEHQRINFEKEDVIFTFTVDTLLNKVIGAQINGDIVSNIVMEKIR